MDTSEETAEWRVVTHEVVRMRREYIVNVKSAEEAMQIVNDGEGNRVYEEQVACLSISVLEAEPNE